MFTWLSWFCGEPEPIEFQTNGVHVLHGTTRKGLWLRWAGQRFHQSVLLHFPWRYLALQLSQALTCSGGTITFAGNEVSVYDPRNFMSVRLEQIWWADREHIVRPLVFQSALHQPSTVWILNRTPPIPWVLSIVQVREDSNFQGSILAEDDTWLVWIWIQTKLAGLQRRYYMN